MTEKKTFKIEFICLVNTKNANKWLGLLTFSTLVMGQMALWRCEYPRFMLWSFFVVSFSLFACYRFGSDTTVAEKCNTQTHAKKQNRIKWQKKEISPAITVQTLKQRWQQNLTWHQNEKMKRKNKCSLQSHTSLCANFSNCLSFKSVAWNENYVRIVSANFRFLFSTSVCIEIIFSLLAKCITRRLWPLH